MAPPRPYSFTRDLLARLTRFLYLLWGGMYLGTMAYFDRIHLPEFFWDWPKLARSLTGPWGQGFLFGVALAMLLASLQEAWELVDLLLVRFMHRHDAEQ